jgi:hypothetical protein
VSRARGRREELAVVLERYYRDCGWPVIRAEDGTVRARGIGGVTWIGLPVVADELLDPAFQERLQALSDERMPSGERCPLELLPSADCAAALRALLDHLRLSERGHVEVYELAA